MPAKKKAKSSKKATKKTSAKKTPAKAKETPPTPPVDPTAETAPPTTEPTTPVETTLPAEPAPPAVEPPAAPTTPKPPVVDTVTPATATETTPPAEPAPPTTTPIEAIEKSPPPTSENSETDSGEREPLDDTDVFGEEPSGNGKKLFLTFLIALISGALIVGAYFFFMSQRSEESGPPDELSTENIPEEAPTEVASDEAKPVEEATTDEVNPSEFDIQILNGSGISGQAGAVQALLEPEGFNNFETDNARSFDFEDTIVQMKETVPTSIFDSIEAALPNYTVTQGDPLDADADYDIIITVGQAS